MQELSFYTRVAEVLIGPTGAVRILQSGHEFLRNLGLEPA